MTSVKGMFRSSLMTLLLAGTLSSPALPQVDSAASAKRIVKSMSDYMASQSNLSGEFDAELDVITPDVEKIQYSASGSLLLERPGKVRLIRKGGYTEMELISDGKMVTIVNLGDGSYSQLQSPGTVDGMINKLRTDYGLDMPGADLLLTNSYAELMDGVIEAKQIGVGVIDGVECDHLAFRNADTDWQLWVRSGDRPLPCKYVIASKTVAASPEYSVRFRNWSSGKAPSAAAFNFVPAKGAKQVAFDQLTGIADLPPPAPPTTGGR